IATIKVTIILNDCAIRNAYNGFLLLWLNKSLKLVSSPMEVNAKANQRPCKLFKLPFTASTVSAEITKENNKEAKTKPITNFGNRSQIIPNVGFCSFILSSPDFETVQ